MLHRLAIKNKSYNPSTIEEIKNLQIEGSQCIFLESSFSVFFMDELTPMFDRRGVSFSTFTEGSLAVIVGPFLSNGAMLPEVY